MILERSHDVAFINRVINHPEIRPYVGAADAGELDATPLIGADEHWALMGEHGGFLLTWSAPGVREVHTIILPEGRGKWAAEARAEGIDYARRHSTRMLWTKIPPKLPQVERFARQGGMKPTGEVIETFGLPYRILKMELEPCQ